MIYIWPKLNVLNRALVVVPVWCSLFAGFAVLGRQFRGWYELGHWSTIDLHDMLNWWVGRPISSHQLEAGLLEVIGDSDMSSAVGKALMELDPLIRWLLNDVPFALWLIVVIPTILLLSSNLRPLSLAKRAKPYFIRSESALEAMLQPPQRDRLMAQRRN